MSENPLLSAAAPAPPPSDAPATGNATVAPSPGAPSSPGAPPAAAQPATQQPLFADLPDHLRGKDDAETAARVAAALKGYRDRDAARGEVPKDAAGYAYKPSDTVAPYLKDMDADPLFAHAKALAAEHGFSTKQFDGFLNGIFGKMVELQLVAPAYDAEAVRARLAPDVADPAQRAVKVDSMVRDAMSYVTALQQQGMPKEAADWMLSQLSEAAPIRMLQWLSGQRPGGAQPALAGQPAGAVTKGDLDRMVIDPRGEVGHAKFDPAFVKMRDDAFRAFYAAKG